MKTLCKTCDAVLTPRECSSCEGTRKRLWILSCWSCNGTGQRYYPALEGKQPCSACSGGLPSGSTSMWTEEEKKAHLEAERKRKEAERKAMEAYRREHAEWTQEMLRFQREFRLETVRCDHCRGSGFLIQKRQVRRVYPPGYVTQSVSVPCTRCGGRKSWSFWVRKDTGERVNVSPPVEPVAPGTSDLDRFATAPRRRSRRRTPGTFGSS